MVSALLLFGIGLADTSGGATNTALFHLVFNNDEAGMPACILKATDANGACQNLAILGGPRRPPIHVRAVYNLDTAGTPGSFSLFMRLDGGTELPIYTTGVLPPEFSLDEIRINAEIGDTTTTHDDGDHVYLDNIVLANVSVPEPGVTVFFGAAAVLAGLRRREERGAAGRRADEAGTGG